ncbi:MAG: ABC transporter ATP-binding protein [Rhodospirillales bacterium]|nr:ABC transporter ATP-binding protein [Rhodospirillales bacterium]
MTTLAIERLTVAFGDRRVLDGVSLVASTGEIVGLIGPNGAGKTTLLKACLGLLRGAAGSITLDGVAIDAIERRRLARMLAYLPQHGACHWPLEVGRLVALGRLPHLWPWQRPSGRDAAAVDAALEAADVRHLIGRIVTELSGGERARVLLARALAAEPTLLLADEPVAGLDPEHQLRIMEAFRSRVAAGAGVVVTLHELGLAARFCDRLVLLSDGRVAVDGPPEAVLTSATLASVFNVHAEVGERDGRRFVVPFDIVRRRDRRAAAE